MRYHENVAKGSREFPMVNVFTIEHHRSTFKPANCFFKFYPIFSTPHEGHRCALEKTQNTQVNNHSNLQLGYHWIFFEGILVQHELWMIALYPFILRLRIILRACRQLFNKDDLYKIRPQLDPILSSLNNLRIDTWWPFFHWKRIACKEAWGYAFETWYWCYLFKSWWGQRGAHNEPSLSVSKHHKPINYS